MPESPPSTDIESLKRDAAREALRRVRPGMRLGLGSGSTMRHFVDLLGEALAEGRLTDIVGVPTSDATRDQATGLGIPLVPLHELRPLDLAVDGADEVDPRLDLIKGLGGAHLREKMIVQASDRFVVIADASKRVTHLGSRSPLPVEVVPFSWEVHLPALRDQGLDPELRTAESGEPYRTDNGNYVLHLHAEGGFEDPPGLDAWLHARAGIVETGFFLGLADEVVFAAGTGIETLERPS